MTPSTAAQTQLQSHATSDIQIGTRGRPHLNPGPTFNQSHIRRANRHQNQFQLIALPQKKREPKGITSTQRPRYSSAPGVSWSPLLKFPISIPFGVPAVTVPSHPYFVGTHYWTVIHREPTLPGGQPGPHINKQTDNSTLKGRSLNVMEYKTNRGHYNKCHRRLGIYPNWGGFAETFFDLPVFADEWALW